MNYSINSRGTCIPKDKTTLLMFKAVQNEANRFQGAAGKKLLVCDGKIGKYTVAAVNGVKNMFPVTGSLGTVVTSCSQIANSSVVFANNMKEVADMNGLDIVACPDGFLQQITRPEPEVDSSGRVTYPSMATTGVGGVPLWILALTGAGGYYYFKKTKSGKKQWKALTKGS
jgi:hypothetical protein